MGNGTELCCWHRQCPGARSHRAWGEHPISQGNRPKPRRAGSSLACQQPLSLLQGVSVNVMRAARAQRQLLQSCYCQQAGAAWGQQSLIHYRMSCSPRGSGPAVPRQHSSNDPPAPRGTAPAQCPGTAIPPGSAQGTAVTSPAAGEAETARVLPWIQGSHFSFLL